jgi:hypothetical protein
MMIIQTAKLIAMQISSRFLDELMASWFFLLSLMISISLTCDSFFQEMGKP